MDWYHPVTALVLISGLSVSVLLRISTSTLGDIFLFGALGTAIVDRVMEGQAWPTSEYE
jgi:hypothetical protein